MAWQWNILGIPAQAPGTVLLRAVALVSPGLWLASGKLSQNYGKSPFLMGKSTISMAIFNSYVKLPEVSFKCANVFHSQTCDDDAPIHQLLIDPTPGVIDLYKFIESI